MTIKYFPDTDTLYLRLSDIQVAETKELNDNVLLDLDDTGKVVAVTIEHARQQAQSLDLSYQLVGN